MAIASITGLGGFPKGSGYGPAKAAAITFTQLLAVELAPSGIRVISIAPVMGCTNDLDSDCCREDLSMPEQRRRFSPQFEAEAEAEAVQMVLETGKPIAVVARDLGINEGTLGTGATSGDAITRSPFRT